MASTKRRWSPEEDDILKRFYAVIPVKEIKAMYLPHRTEASIYMRFHHLGLTKAPPVFKKQKTEVMPTDDYDDIVELWDALIRFQNASKKLSTRVDHVDLMIDTDTPIAVGFLADAHIGAVSCRYDELLARFDEMAGIPDFYLFSVGDTVDNYLPQWHSQGMFGQIVPPELQKQLVEKLYIRMKGRWLGAVQGCHDEASHNTDDFDWTKYLCQQLECPNLGFGGTVDLTVGEQTYRIMLRHRYRFNSSFNLTHTVKRMREQLGDFDIGCIAHHHQAACEQVILGDGRDRVFIRPGSFKGADRYSRQLGFADTGACIPVVILFPHERMMIPFLHLEQARMVLNSRTSS